MAASLIIICRPLGVLLEGFIVDRFGRKTTMQIATFFFVLSWLCTALSDSLVMLYASRMMTGFSLGECSGAARVLVLGALPLYSRPRSHLRLAPHFRLKRKNRQPLVGYVYSA